MLYILCKVWCPSVVRVAGVKLRCGRLSKKIVAATVVLLLLRPLVGKVMMVRILERPLLGWGTRRVAR